MVLPRHLRDGGEPNRREAPGGPGASRSIAGAAAQDFFSPIEEAARAADRTTDASPTYVRVRHDAGRALPEQGWKLHVSADVVSSGEVLSRTLPILLSEGAAFKVVRSVPRLGALNDGRGGLSQVGKFVTVYPGDDEEAVRLAVALDRATRGLSGPSVTSDRALRPGSLIHYRYGGFGTRIVQAPSGEVLPAISAPNGMLVPDGRGGPYRAPPWVKDPFAAAGVVEPEEAGETAAVGERFVVSHVLHRSPAGAVHRALDMRDMRRCVLKSRSGPGREYLRNEADALDRLAGNPAFPQPYGLVEGEDDELFLALEEIDGEPLAQHVRSLNRQGRNVPAERVAAWGREVAAMLGRVHGAGLVYRDLKLDNLLLTPDGRLRMVDFELACKIGDGNVRGVGTRGYASPQRVAGEPPAVSDDVYGLGALLYALATGAAPELAPNPHALLDRPVGLLNPASDSDLVEAISRCLDPDLRTRYPSTDALAAALAETGSRAASPPSHERAAETEEEARRRWRGLAQRLGNTLVDAARPARDGRGLLWTSPVPGVGEFPLRDLCAGVAGTVFALSGLVEEFGDPAHRDALERGSRWLASSSPVSHPSLPGLYVGEAGVGAALLRAGRALDNDELVEAAVGKGLLVSALPHASPDLFNGSAGRLRFHLTLHDETGDDKHLHHAVGAGEALLAHSQDDGYGPLWTIPPGYGGMSGRAHLGYAHGVAGIADALLDLFEATEEDRFLTTAVGAGRRLARLAVPVLDDDSGLDWPPVEGAPPAGAAWCHGATGIGRFFLNAARLDALPGAMDIALRAARTAARGGRYLGPVRCHGLAGNIEFLLDAYRMTGDPSIHADIRVLGCLLEAFGRDRDGLLVFPSDAPDAFASDYMTGYAGVAICALRLADPDRTPGGFRYSI